MKSSILKGFNLEGFEFLSKTQMGKITGGVSDLSVCDRTKSICHQEGQTVYYCSVETDANGDEECCCGHSAYNSECFVA